MLRLFVLVLALIGLPALAQPPASAPAAAAGVRVALVTDRGRIVVEVDTARAPVTAGNFLRYVDARRLDGTEFYRAMKTAPAAGLVQGGVRDPRQLFPPIAHEPTSQTGLSHTDGALSVPRFAPGTAQGDFTIMVGDQLYLDAQPGSAGDGLGYAVFGRVVEGMDVVRAILQAPTSATEGEGVMRGQMLDPRIRVVTARRVSR
ncbi:peptidylprolyl isomerase [Sphingosinicella sp. LHD-64]|uniref:peptidylprolyl isomerase n=1 Tax=Sphingosinicella sp. LHD-64 TaxID=3072139 RepID=UPI00280C8EA2|nr:peptidylprolyl isomerase [Sphingosinicella sp. LHD-64]MDQ8754781.1 peptidylprolyl isomerase [Sphingosinicella sp. LHD-64]